MLIMLENFQALVRELLQTKLPGKPAQQRMLAIPRKPVPETLLQSRNIPAATLFLMYPEEDHIRFILTKRSQQVDHHKGQIAFPGGVQDPGERLVDTALRETREEIGIAPEAISILGNLSPLYVRVTGYHIHPFVGWIDYEPKVIPAPDEVEDVFSVPLSQLMDETTVQREDITISGFPVSVPFFQFDAAKVWGATAMILSEFKELLKKHYVPDRD